MLDEPLVAMNPGGLAGRIRGQQPAEPFRIAGNFYYLGANDISAFLITGPKGHVVLDGGYHIDNAEAELRQGKVH